MNRIQHKDTDLGFFAAIILAEAVGNPTLNQVTQNKKVATAISYAEELIRQLDEKQTKK